MPRICGTPFSWTQACLPYAPGLLGYRLPPGASYGTQPLLLKVDPNGNQLPYIDAIIHELHAEAQSIVLKAVGGEIDMQGRLLGGMLNSSLFLAYLPANKYRLVPKNIYCFCSRTFGPELEPQRSCHESNPFGPQVQKSHFSCCQQG